MEMLSLGLLAVLLVSTGAVLTGLLAERLPSAVTARADDGRFAGLGDAQPAHDDQRATVTTGTRPSVI